MTLRELLIGVGAAALALAAFALAFALRAIMRRARAGRRRIWGGLVFRGILIAGLVAAGVASLGNLPPPDMVNRPAPATAGATVAFIQTERAINPRTVVGASARTGATRWTRTLGDPKDQIASLLRPSPAMILAMMFRSVYALRASDGATLWQYRAPTGLYSTMVAVGGGRVVVLMTQVSGPRATEVIALSLATGALDWRISLPVSVAMTPQVVVGDGLVVVSSDEFVPGVAVSKLVVVALDAWDGASRWIKTTVVPDLQNAMVRAMFVMQRYAIIVPLVGPVLALRESDGATAWTGTPYPDEPNTLPQINAATADNDTIYIVAEPWRWRETGANGSPIPPPASLVAMSVGGTVHWAVSDSAGSRARSSLALSDGVLLSGMSIDPSRAWVGYYPTGSLLTAYDAASGRALWRDNTPPTGISWDMTPEITPQNESGVVFLMGIQSDPYIQDRFTCIVFCRPGVSWLYAVNVHTGASWWRASIGFVNLKTPLPG